MSRILIAEDEERIASFLEKGLHANGFTTEVAADGHEAPAARRAPAVSTSSSSTSGCRARTGSRSSASCAARRRRSRS